MLQIEDIAYKSGGKQHKHKETREKLEKLIEEMKVGQSFFVPDTLMPANTTISFIRLFNKERQSTQDILKGRVFKEPIKGARVYKVEIKKV
jgi:hypothetical protein